jgi:beta-lactamase class A
MTTSAWLASAVERETRGLRGKMTVCLARLGEEPDVEIQADESVPLASVFKLGVLVELFRRVDARELSLESRWTVRSEDLSPEDDILIALDLGLRPTVRDLATLMIIVSDNTATDILFKRLGLRRINETLRGLGLESTDIFCPNREWYLLLLGYSPRYRGDHVAALRRKWESLSSDGRFAEMEWLWQHGRRVTKDTMLQQIHDQDFAGTTRTRAWRLWEEATDNHGSARDVVRLLDLIARARAASRRSCAEMVRILELQQFHRLSLGLPPGTRVANKTGSIAGVINDAGIVFPRTRPPFVAVCLTHDLTSRQEKDAVGAISRVARAAWRAWGDP